MENQLENLLYFRKFHYQGVYKELYQMQTIINTIQNHC